MVIGGAACLPPRDNPQNLRPPKLFPFVDSIYQAWLLDMTLRVLGTLLFATTALTLPQARAGALFFEVTESQADAFQLSGGLSGHVITAAIAGTFSITNEPGSGIRLDDFNLRLVNVSENFALPHFDVSSYENKPLQDLLPLDMETLPSLGSVPYGRLFVFAEPLFTLPDRPIYQGPTVSMRVDSEGGEARIKLASRLTALGTLDGPTVMFKPIIASVVPEPAALSLCAVGIAAFAALRRRRQPRRVPAAGSAVIIF